MLSDARDDTELRISIDEPQRRARALAYAAELRSSLQGLVPGLGDLAFPVLAVQAATPPQTEAVHQKLLRAGIFVPLVHQATIRAGVAGKREIFHRETSFPAG